MPVKYDKIIIIKLLLKRRSDKPDLIGLVLHIGKATSITKW